VLNVVMGFERDPQLEPLFEGHKRDLGISFEASMDVSRDLVLSHGLGRDGISACKVFLFTVDCTPWPYAG
jgi:hypothetical protein